jgi:hypothetical protein
MEQRVARAEYPWWVKVSMMGVPGRGGVLGCAVLSVMVGVAGLIFWRNDPVLWPTSLFLIAAIPYWLTIRWVDRHGSWDNEQAR